MTRGPEPLKAIDKAMKNSAARGKVIDRDHLRESRIQFILFCASLTVFVLVRRTRVHLTSPEDCAYEYRMDILRLRRVPLTNVDARELWLLTPWGTWQYFRILDDRVIEIRADGTSLLTEKTVPAKSPEPAPGPDVVPEAVPDMASLPGLYPVGAASSSDDGG
ncbi:MAG: hypothetical protein LUQ66_03775 [Methanoregula sp.]|nr:hypothetical protein [Methanoregula sp.]